MIDSSDSFFLYQCLMQREAEENAAGTFLLHHFWSLQRNDWYMQCLQHPITGDNMNIDALILWSTPNHLCLLLLALTFWSFFPVSFEQYLKIKIQFLWIKLWAGI